MLASFAAVAKASQYLAQIVPPHRIFDVSCERGFDDSSIITAKHSGVRDGEQFTHTSQEIELKQNGLTRLLAVSACILASTASLCFAQVTSLSAGLRGSNEVPPNASLNSGTTIVTIDATTGALTWNTNSTIPVSSATGHHIHRGVAGANGPVIINFNALYSGALTITPALAAEIVGNPSGFYVNLHTQAFGGGEIRGQLVGPAAPAGAVPALSLPMLLALGLGLAAIGATVFRHSKRA